MKNISLLLYLILLSGCAPLVTRETVFDKPQDQETTKTFYIAVTSEPTDAEVYYDNQLIGRTPLQQFPLVIPTYYTPYKPIVSAEYYRPKGDHFIRVSKTDYLDATETLSYRYYQSGYGDASSYDLYKKEFHFVLEPRPEYLQKVNSQAVSDSSTSKSNLIAVAGELQLQAIFYEKEKPIAKINNKIVKIGDRIGNRIVIDILKDKVVIYDYDQAKNFELMLN